MAPIDSKQNSSPQNRRILAVDDEFEVLEHYRRIFTTRDPEALLAHDKLVNVLESGLNKLPVLDEARNTYQLDGFSQGAEAVDAVRQALNIQQPYAVALIDMRMPPGMDGLETARQIRALDREINIIFITAFSDYTADSVFHQVSGSVLWFRKPFHSGEIYQAVYNSCLQWNQAHELEQLREELAYRVDLQTDRLQSKMKSVSMLQKNSLKRELKMGDMKRELRSLKAYQDLRLLLSSEELSEPQALSTTVQPVELLLVDDSATVRTIYQSQLEAVGFDVVVASSVDEAFKIAQQHPPEVALIDFYMPGGNGDQLITMLRSDPHTMYVLPLLFTNAGDEMMAVQSGAAYWMNKDNPAFLTRMELVRDYVQQNRSLHASYATAEAFSENRRVLLVDDEQQNLDIIASYLGAPEGQKSSENEVLLNQLMQDSAVEPEPEPAEQSSALDFQLTTLQQGADAITAVREAQFAEHPYAVAVIDMRMPPGIDGLETARQIRQISPQIEIIILTAFSDYTLDQIRDVLGHNFSFLEKPCKPKELQQRVVEGCAQWATAHEVNASHHALLNLAEDMEQENIRRKEVEEELLQANRTKDDFLSSMSHELRTPLTTMIGYNEIMMDERGVPLQFREMVESSLLAGRTLLQLVNDVLDMSKIRAGKFSLSEHPFNLRKVVDDVSALMQTFGSQKGVKVELQLEPGIDELLSYQWSGDEMRLSQVLFNLLSNAVKFSEQQGVVELYLGRVKRPQLEIPGLRYFELRIKDSGIGMSPEVQERLFTPFEQADSSTARRFGGTGLGLFIVKQLVQMMGGRIEAISEEGVGSTFIAEIPFKETGLPVVAAEPELKSADIPTLSGRVLLAEDTIQLQRLATILLEKSGAEVDIANNGVEALERGQQSGYQLILMDMQMPEMDGIEATRRLRELGVETPIYALTANVMQQHREMFEAAGCDGFLSKPIRRNKLYAVLSQYLDADTAPAQEPIEVEEVELGGEASLEDDDLSDLMDEEMMAEFWDYIREARGTLERSWRDQEWGTFRSTAHAIKGMGSSYGQSKMTKYAAKLQDHALSGNVEVMREPYERLLELLR